MHGNAVLADQVLEDPLGHMRFEDPHGPLVAVDRGRALAAVAIAFALLPAPGVGLVVVLPDPVVELAREPADDALVASVGPAQAAARESAEVAVGAHDDDRLAHALRLDGRGDRRRGAAIDHHVIRLPRAGKQRQREEKEGSEAEGNHGISGGVTGADQVVSRRANPRFP